MGIASRKYFPSDVTNEYEILTPMGKSDRWETYRIIRRSDEVSFVLTMDRKFPNSSRGRRATGDAYLRLRRVRHPAFPVLERMGLLHSGGHYVVREFIRGVNLRNLGKHLDFPFLIDVLAKLLPPLHLLHMTGFVHGRISPEKIIVSSLEADRTVHLVDLGLPAHPDYQRWAPPAYRAPEWNSGRTVDGRADLYSIAVLAYELLAGRRPFPVGEEQPKRREVQTECAPELRMVPHDTPRRLDQFISRSVMTDRRARPDSALKAAYKLIHSPENTKEGFRLRAEKVSETLLEQTVLSTGTGNEDHAGATLTVEQIRHAVLRLCKGPIEQARSAILARWCIWKTKGCKEAVTSYLADCIQESTGELYLNWSKVASEITEHVSHNAATVPQNRQTKEFTQMSVLAKSFKDACMPLASARALELTIMPGDSKIRIARKRLTMAVRCREGGETTKAKEHLEEAHKNTPGDAAQLRTKLKCKARMMDLLTTENDTEIAADDEGQAESDCPQKAEGYLELATRYVHARWLVLAGRYSESRDIAEEAVRGLQGISRKKKAERITAANGQYMSWLETQFRKIQYRIDALAGNPKRAIKNIQRVIADQSVGQSRASVGHLWSLLSSSYLLDHQYRKGKRAALAAGRAGVIQGSTRRVAAAMINIAYANQMLGKEHSMKQWISPLLRVANEGGTVRNELRILQNVTGLYEECYDYEEGILCALRGLRIAKMRAMQSYIGKFMFNVGMMYKLLGLYGRALHWVERARQQDPSVEMNGLEKRLLIERASLAAKSCGNERFLRILKEVVSEDNSSWALQELSKDPYIRNRLTFLGSNGANAGLIMQRTASARTQEDAAGMLLQSRSRSAEAGRCVAESRALIDVLLWMPVDEIQAELASLPTLASRLRELGEVLLSVRLSAIGAMRFAALGWIDVAQKCIIVGECGRGQMARDRYSDREVVGALSLVKEGVVAKELVARSRAALEKVRDEIELMKRLPGSCNMDVVRDPALSARLTDTWSFIRTILGCGELGMTVIEKRKSGWLGREFLSNREESVFQMDEELDHAMKLAGLKFCMLERNGMVQACARSHNSSIAIYIASPRTAVTCGLDRERIRRVLKSSIIMLEHLAGTTQSLEGSRKRHTVQRDVVRAKGCARKQRSDLVYRSEAMASVVRDIERLAKRRVHIILQGESGTGKELLANWAHRCGGGKGGDFVVVDCPSLCPSLVESELFGHVVGAFSGATETRKGLLESAHRGTLFLDEVCDMPLDIQAKLLRVLSCGEFRAVGSGVSMQCDLFTVSATNACITDLVERGEFRADLMYRLGVEVHVPPLRDRREDIVPLWEHFLGIERDVRQAYEEGVINVLLMYEWPGNVRELWNCVRCIVARAEGRLIEKRFVEEVLARAVPAATCQKAIGQFRSLSDRSICHIERLGSITRRGYASTMGVSTRTALRDLNALVETGVIVRCGKGRATKYYPAMER